MDFGELELRTLGNTIHLTVMEAELLRYLVRSDGRVVARKSILEDVWGLHEDTDTRAIDNFVVRLTQIHRGRPGASEAPGDSARGGIPFRGLAQRRVKQWRAREKTPRLKKRFARVAERAA